MRSINPAQVSIAALYGAAMLLAFATLGAVFLLASYTAKPATSASTCTMVIGGSVMGSPNGGWYPADNYGFERIVPNGSWQYIWQSGADNSVWSNPNSSAWSQWPSGVISGCTTNRLTPDRVVYWVGIKDPSQSATTVADQIGQAVANIRAKIPSVQKIILQPITGGPNHTVCGSPSGGNGYIASAGHLVVDPAIDLAISRDPSLGKGYDSLVRTCSDFKDWKGHLSDSGATDQGQKHGQFYAALDAGPTATPTPTPTATPTPMPPVLTSCERVATYSDGSKVIAPLPLSDC